MKKILVHILSGYEYIQRYIQGFGWLLTATI